MNRIGRPTDDVRSVWGRLSYSASACGTARPGAVPASGGVACSMTSSARLSTSTVARS